LSVLWSLSACGTPRLAIEPSPHSTLYQCGVNPTIDQQIAKVEQLVAEQRQASQKTYYLIPSSTDAMAQYTLIDTLKSYYRERSGWARETSVGDGYYYAASNEGQRYLMINLVPLTDRLLLIEGISQE
jgi:hypothetical protein